MHLRILLLFTLFCCKSMLFSQISVPNPSKSDFSEALTILASDSMQGRKANQKGGFMAADYIASKMYAYNLKSFAKIKSYYQTFKIQEHSIKNTTLEFKKGNQETISLSSEKDFQTIPTSTSINKKEIEVIFAGYGLSLPKENYDDYKKRNVKNKVVVVLSGFPNDKDSTSATYKKFKKIFPEENDLEETKLKTAISKGAIALIVIETHEYFKSPKTTQNEVFHSLENPITTSIPVFKIHRTTAENLFSKISIPSKNGLTSTSLQKVKVNFSIELESKTFPVANVLGMLSGKDTTKTIIVGAHYDHLGVKNDSIYNGADDNASGTSGMLALAKKWSESKTKPNYNLLFASWTAEEMGLLGSEYFVQNFDFSKQKILLAINMDMISRSAPEDKLHRILSIGTQKEDENLRKMSTEINSKLQNPFSLDLWETNGHSGSDYASFTAKGIPIMTFFSGFHDDYHTPNDKASKVDFDKIHDVLFIVNSSLLKFLENPNN
ncbi:M20/M25/M40 family metallo-hydrolase [Flavobacterium zhairuonense]|uniref:M20/M25/M40 family metallo-hydrolase n=1 Tax=Flavobacterium zhairuonense TaxID=2493631 RepID=UPI00104DB50C|nr:M20/M25/M40 family metallo-hydrolase [Flavobacterium zhairuonense]KAF2509570.1 M20/M25/M40 family metallo-hydrolase [Flavobacterium zhairuonense]